MSQKKRAPTLITGSPGSAIPIKGCSNWSNGPDEGTPFRVVFRAWDAKSCLDWIEANKDRYDLSDAIIDRAMFGGCFEVLSV